MVEQMDENQVEMMDEWLVVWLDWRRDAGWDERSASKQAERMVVMMVEQFYAYLDDYSAVWMVAKTDVWTGS